MQKGFSLCFSGQQSSRGVITVNENSKAIVILCSHLCVSEKMKPYETAEWAKLADRLVTVGISPYELLTYSDDDMKQILGFEQLDVEKILRLIGRSGSIAFEIERYASMGINIVTRADNHYPKALKKKLGKSCPPLFYYAGCIALADQKSIGYVGSRNIDEDDVSFTVRTVEKTLSEGFAVVSGGAKGIDSTAGATSLVKGGISIEYISDSLTKRIKEQQTIKAVIDEQLLILSHAKPDAGFTTGMAMARNKYIYSQSEGTVVVKSDYNKGGTWSGAVENLKNKKCPTFCWNNENHTGNIELIKRGAIPIDDNWNSDVFAYHSETNSPTQSEQLSLFSE